MFARWSHLCALLGLVCEPAFADCIEPGDVVALTGVVGPAIVKLQVDGVGAGCSEMGTGFFVAKGYVLTADHVIPRGCKSQEILGQAPGLGTFRLTLVEPRSSLDVALLKSDVDNLNSLAVVRPIQDAKVFVNKRVTIASYYPEYPDPTLTSARVDSTVVINDAPKWGLCAVAANPGRSGSPVVLDDGSVLAVFVERPGNGYQDIARVIPLAAVADIPLLDEARGPGIVKFSDGAGQPIASTSKAEFSYDFTIATTTSGHPDPTQNQDRYLYFSEDGRLVPADQMSDADILLQVLLNDAKIRFAEPHTEQFVAVPGYRFSPDVRIDVVSLNPPITRVPSLLCRGQQDRSCYELSPDQRTLTLRYDLFTGPIVDQSRGWISASVQTRQVPDDAK